MMHLRKDRSLDELAKTGNVAQFVSWVPSTGSRLSQTYSRVLGYEPNHVFSSPMEAVVALLASSPEKAVNVRSYAPESPRSREFIYSRESALEVVAAVQRLAAEGLHVIVNETIDVGDGGVSGVLQGSLIEFAPDDIPRCVEKPGVASLPTALGLRLLETVYGFQPDFGRANGRIEFSVHPRPRGWRSTHTVLWEQEDADDSCPPANLAWPNRFSRHIGDKLYGLLMAHLIGLPVPETVAICRRVAAFRFGQSTGSAERWIRTCPVEQEPGLFTTSKGWTDPFALLAKEDPRGNRIASVLSQAAVPAQYAGASIMTAAGELVAEGVRGDGDLFMLGEKARDEVPPSVVRAVTRTVKKAQAILGPVRTEWVFDGTQAWIVQLHLGATQSRGSVLVPGDAEHWTPFHVADGLDELRSLISTLDGSTGIELNGHIGMTSHIADLIRKAGHPARISAAA
jgi:hypothetical protein